MPGRCAECGKSSYEQADDGKYYCDVCWHKWTDHHDWARKEKEAKQQQVIKEKEARKQALRKQKESDYWLAKLQVTLPEQLEPCSQSRIPVAFWGICDLKYDPRLPEKDRIKILELGDGKSSRFSNHGAAIEEKFKAMFHMDENPVKRGVLVENKKLTHDTFVDCGLGFMRPSQFCYPRRYDTNLAKRIMHDLQLKLPDGEQSCESLADRSDQHAVVLKLVNRCRGAGVVVCPVTELDATLRQLLRPPVGRNLDEWFKETAPRALTQEFSATDPLAEHKLHFWSNECPDFVAEQLCRSIPMQAEAFGAGEEFDGTLRVSFALRRGSERQDKFEIDWLGGYWKLPPASISRSDSRDMARIHHQLVSSFNSSEKRTAEAEPGHLDEVFRSLTPAMLAVFAVELGEPKDILSLYPEDSNFRAYVMARQCAALRVSMGLSSAQRVLDQAKKLVRAPSGNPAVDVPQSAVLSYIERTKGVNFAMCQNWVFADQCFVTALRMLPTNASAHYLRGIVLEETDRHAEAVEAHQRALALDPDFRSPLMSLARCYTHLDLYEDAMSACHACLQRQPDAPVAQQNMAQAIYQQLTNGWEGSESEAAELRRKALDCLEIARVRCPHLWSEVEEEMEAYLKAESGHASFPRQPLHLWRQYGWRP